jgi:hypothetical protein
MQATKRIKIFPLFVPPRLYSKSVFLFVAVCFYDISVFFSPPFLLRYLLAKKGRPQENWVVEVWLILLLVLGWLVLDSAFISWYVRYVLACYFLLDTVAATLRDIVVSPIVYRDKKGPFLSIHNPSRWLLVTVVSVFLIIEAFALLFLNYGWQFYPPITDAITASYVSLVTFTTSGYGDIKPVGWAAKRLVCAELLFFLFFLAVKIPLAVSVVRTKSRDIGGK